MKDLSSPSFERAFTGHTGPIYSLHCRPSSSPLFRHPPSFSRSSLCASSPPAPLSLSRSTRLEFVSGSVDHSIIIWSYRPHLAAFRLLGHSEAVSGVRYRPGPVASHVASSSHDGTLRLWSTVSSSSASHSSTCRVLSLRDPLPHLSHPRHVPHVKGFDVDWDYSGIFLSVACSDDRVRIFSVKGGEGREGEDDDLQVGVERTGTLYGHISDVRKARFSPEGRMIASGSDDGTVRLWDVERLHALRCYEDEDDQVGIGRDTSVIALSPHPQGNLVAAANERGHVLLIDTRTHTLAQRYTSPAHVHDLMFHPFGLVLYSACADGAVNLTDLASGRLEVSARSHNESVYAVAANDEGEVFMTGGEDHNICCWTHSQSLVAKQQESRRLTVTNESEIIEGHPAMNPFRSHTPFLARTMPDPNARETLYSSQRSKQVPNFSRSLSRSMSVSNNQHHLRPHDLNKSKGVPKPQRFAFCSSYAHTHTGTMTQKHHSYPIQRVHELAGPSMQFASSKVIEATHLHASDVDEELQRIPRDLNGTLQIISKRISDISSVLSRLDQRLESCETKTTEVGSLWEEEKTQVCR